MLRHEFYEKAVPIGPDHQVLNVQGSTPRVLLNNLRILRDAFEEAAKEVEREIDRYTDDLSQRDY